VVPGVSPLILLVKEPVPLLLLVWVLSGMEGLGEVLQTTPLVRMVTSELVTTPPLTADVVAILLTGVVVTVGRLGVIKDTWFPYAVPTELLAYART
jgi:hypothetical protein